MAGMILTSRQVAIVVWLAVFVGGALMLAGVRSSVRSLLRTLCSPKLAVLFVIVIGYNIAAVWLLWRVGFWNQSMIYDTVLYIAVGAIGSVGRAATRGATYDASFFLGTVVVNFEVMVVLAFLSDFFPLPFWIEFLVVVPCVTILVMLVVVSERQKGAEEVHLLLTRIQALVGLLLIAYIAWRVIASYQQLMHLQVLFSLELPVVMSAFFVPVLFLVCAMFGYEDAFLVISFRSGGDRRLARWKKRRLVLRFGPRLTALQAFRRSGAIHEYGWIRSKCEARALLNSWPSVQASMGPESSS